MDSRKLEDKIKRVFYFIVGGIVVYLLISFTILSSFPWYPYQLNKKLAYDVLKDAFTIGAAFLVPIAAFVLFTDWRVEHKIKSTLQLLDDMKNLSYDIKNELGFYQAKIIKEKEIPIKEFRNREDRQTIQWQLKKLKRMNGQFLIDNVEVKEFQNLQSEFVDLATKALEDLHFSEYFSFEIALDKNFINSDYNNNEYLKYVGLFEIKFKGLEDLSNQIDLQFVNVQNSILQT
ncbi:hypothetical protein KC099_11015 [Acinetobacter nosocomialis]|uniref:hypothetical protein n=1 Tax=Acinetobacter nosocomialis TaxID=106654 RepID=UPI001B83951D|nr:hypothetical protein [Acinetobacter nosocomialis]MBR7713726.1 hypothetical protein [Acinetobacter nosocomialis]